MADQMTEPFSLHNDDAQSCTARVCILCTPLVELLVVRSTNPKLHVKKNATTHEVQVFHEEFWRNVRQNSLLLFAPSPNCFPINNELTNFTSFEMLIRILTNFSCSDELV